MSKSAVGLSASDISEKWARRTKGAVADIQKGIMAVTESPMEAAVRKQDKMRTNLNAAIDSGRWAKGLQAVPLDQWRQTTAKKVGERLPGGIDAAMPKRQQFDQYLVNTLNTILPKVKAMPDLTMEDSLNRVRAVMEGMHNSPYRK